MIKPVERNIYVDTASGIYIIRKFRKGRPPLWHSTGERSIKAARAIKDQIISDWLGNRPRNTRRAFSELFEETLRIKKTKAYKTALSAEGAIKHLKPWFDANCAFLDQFNEATWEQYILSERENARPRRLKHDREILIFTLNLGRKKGWLSKVYSLRKPDAIREVGRYFSDDEIERLIRFSPTPDLRFQIQIAAKMGMRLREILHLSWDRVDIKEGWISLYAEHTKTKRKRFIPIHDDLLLEFRRRAAIKKSVFVFPGRGNPTRPQDNNASSWWTCRERAGVLGRFHDLRHRAITDMLASGISETDVSKITSASPQVIARIYHHLRPDTLERVRKLNCGKFVGRKEK